jgi:hypothetical protein
MAQVCRGVRTPWRFIEHVPRLEPGAPPREIAFPLRTIDDAQIAEVLGLARLPARAAVPKPHAVVTCPP